MPLRAGNASSLGSQAVPKRWLCCSASCDARASRHCLLGSGKGYPKCAIVLLFPILPSAVQGQAACGQVWQLPGLGSKAHKCLREVLVLVLDFSGQQGGGTDGYMKARRCFRRTEERRMLAGRESPGSSCYPSGL